MTTISMSATHALPALMPGRASPRKSQHAAALPVAGPVPLGLRLLPRAMRDAMVHRARQRELEAAFARLAETSPHLLADIGVGAAGVAEAAPAVTWTRALPAPGAAPAAPPVSTSALSRSRRRLVELDDHLLKDIGISRAQAWQEARRPSWNAPDFWMR